MDEIKKDSRFSHIKHDIRFKNIPKSDKKVKIDKRFQSMFTDERFQLKSIVDKRGRPLVAKGSEHLNRFYDLSSSDTGSSDDDDDSSEKEKHEGEEVNSNVATEFNSDIVKESNESKSSDLTPNIKAKLKDLTVDYARGEGVLLSDSSSDEESNTDEEEKEEVEHKWGELDREAEVTSESTPRLALCHMDWDRITAEDIMVLIHSFLPPGGLLKSVTVYPSEFGLARLKDEEEKGPKELANVATPDVEDEEGISITQREAIREYQLKRLRYFYAVLVFDSTKTADHVYKECDGLEYESSMNRLDLRFVPEDTVFEQTPREDCNELPDLATYKPSRYRTTALTQVKVDLTWDETDPAREEVIRAAREGKFDDKQINKFLASSSDEEEAEEEPKEESKESPEEPVTEKKAIEKYKALLANLSSDDKPKDDVAMEVTWDLKKEQMTAERIKQATKSAIDKTPFEQFLDKRKEKKKMKKDQRKAEMTETNSDVPFSDDDIPSDIDLNDEYFRGEMEKPKGKKKKKKATQQVSEDEEEKHKREELELLMLDEISEDPKRHFSLKKIEENEKKKKKRKLKKKPEAPVVEDGFKMDVGDERFSAIFTSHLYNVDPAQPFFKATQGMKALIAEKVKRKCGESDTREDPETKIPEKKKRDAELSLLVKSVQRKSQAAKQKRLKN